MSKRKVTEYELYNDLVETIKDKIEEQINDEYTAMKIQYLDNLEYRLERCRNETVRKVLDSIDIVYRQDNPIGNNVIEIKIIKE